MFKGTNQGPIQGLRHGTNGGYSIGNFRSLLGLSGPMWDPDAAKYIQYMESRFGGGLILVAAFPQNWKKAVNTLVLKLKAMGAWDDADLIYPFIGGTKETHSVNLKNPGGGNEIIWHGTTFHDYRGARGDGSSGYGDTLFVLNAAAGKKYTQNNASMAVYLTANNSEAYGGAPFSLGGLTAFTTLIGAIRHQNQTNTEPFINANSGNLISNGGPLGFTMGSRRSGAAADFRNGITGPNLSTSTSTSGNNCFILTASFAGTPYSFTRFSMGFAFVGGGKANQMEMWDAVEQFQKALGRSVF